MHRYTGFVDCPCCFESCGYLGSHDKFSDGSDCFTPSDRPCPECNGTGKVECEPRTFDDLVEEIEADLQNLASANAQMALEHAEGRVGSTEIESGRAA